jgi:hypothetical protein
MATCKTATGTSSVSAQHLVTVHRTAPRSRAVTGIAPMASGSTKRAAKSVSARSVVL